LIETAKIHSIDPQAYLADILAKLVDGCPAHKLDELLPWTWAEQNRLAPRPDCGSTQSPLGRQCVVAPPLTVELREVTKHTRRIPRCHTSRRDVLGDDAARTNYGAAADADAGKDNRL
jgi:IS66 C-terminal element